MKRSDTQSPDDLDVFLTPEDFEVLYKIPRSTQAAMRSRRELPFVQLGSRTPRYRRSDIALWLSSRAVAPLEHPLVEPRKPRRGAKKRAAKPAKKGGTP